MNSDQSSRLQLEKQTEEISQRSLLDEKCKPDTLANKDICRVPLLDDFFYHWQSVPQGHVHTIIAVYIGAMFKLLFCCVLQYNNFGVNYGLLKLYTGLIKEVHGSGISQSIAHKLVIRLES